MINHGIKPYIADLYPDKAQYLSGTEVKIILEAVNPCSEEIKANVILKVSCLEEEILCREVPVAFKPRETITVPFVFSFPPCAWKGFGADAVLMVGDQPADELSTAFDIVQTWKKAIRYGFLCDFYAEDEGDAEDVKQMAKFHINVVQFYDWMYRHENLIPPEDYFFDPLGRRLSLKAIKNKIRACVSYGMKTFAYGAIYGAGRSFFENHRDWALYNNLDCLNELGDWLVIMNPSENSPWCGHIMQEYRKALEFMGFDGIHLDTYGFPKRAFSVAGHGKKLVKMEEHYPVFIGNVRKALEGAREDLGLIFNAVNNWAVDFVAEAEQDAVYIEVWPPHDRYIHLYHLVRHALEKGGKPVILAAYLKPYSDADRTDINSVENSMLLLSSVIAASGGYHLILGEKNGVLTEGYYVTYGVMRDEFVRTMRNYYDFIVRYANLLFERNMDDLSMTHANGINEEIVFENGSFSSYGEPGKIWTIVKEMPGYLVIHMINLSGIESDIWNEPKRTPPLTARDIGVGALVYEDVEGVYVASPDIDNGRARQLDFGYVEKRNGRYTAFTVPELKFWDMVYIKLKA